MPLKIEHIVVFAGYRDWSEKILSELELQFPDCVFLQVRTNSQLIKVLRNLNVDLVLMAGWSWIVPSDLVEKVPIYGMHPSDLPKYAGGSPIQHQIIDGVLDSKISIFQLSPELDAGAIVGKSELDLRGHLDQIFERITQNTILLFSQLLHEFPNVKSMENASDEFETRRRLKPEDSRIEKNEILNLSCLNLFNLIRAREEPYPNVYICLLYTSPSPRDA